MTENQDLTTQAAALNLGNKFDKAADIEYAGGKHLWKHLIRGPTPAWQNIAEGITKGFKPF